jgi:hypothetical protein
VIIECSSCSKKMEMKKRNTSKTIFSNQMDYNCYDHIVRDKSELNRIKLYIRQNPKITIIMKKN